MGLTLFAFIAFVGLCAGGLIGFRMGNHHFGILGAIIGILLGGFIGLTIGYLPNILVQEWMFREMRRSSNSKLRTIVEEQYWTFRQTLALLNLQLRGEDVQSYLPRVITLLESNDLRSQYFGRDALALVFAPLAEKIGRYDPLAPEEARRRQIAMLRDAPSLKEN